MFDTPRRALAAAVALLAVSHVLLAQAGTPSVPLTEVERYEGQTVVVEGAVRAVAARDDGTRFTLADAGHALEVIADDASGLHAGTAARAEGRLGRLGPDLVLFARSVQAGEPPPAATVALSSLASEPEPGGWARVAGTVRDGRLHQDGTSIALGDGPWPDAGRVTATVLPVREVDCACTRLHAHGVRAWTD